MWHWLLDLPRVGVRPQLRPALRLRDAPGSLRITLELYWQCSPTRSTGRPRQARCAFRQRQASSRRSLKLSLIHI
eukprot:9950058-Alexandrium_andersonii.AAC.1